MAFSLTTRRIRMQSDYDVDGAVVDRLTGKEIQMPLASDVRIEIGIFAGLKGGNPSSAAQVASETGWESLTLTLQRQRGANVVSKTVSSFSSLTVAAWNADTGQHCTVDLTDAETNIAPGKYRLALTVESSTFGPYPVGTADIQVFDPNNLNSSDPADENPGAPISRDAADLRYAPIGGGSSALSAGNSLFVDAVEGDNATGTRERIDKPFLTPEAARDESISGDMIYVRSGSYTTATSLAKDGVDWDFASNTTVTCTDKDVSIWDDGNTAMVFTVTGDADFVHTGSALPSFDIQRCIRLRHASSSVTIHCRDIICTNSAGGLLTALYQQAGFVDLQARIISTRASIGGYGVWWFNGEGHVRASQILSDYVCVASSVDATPTGDFHVTADYLENSIFSDGTNATAALWVTCHIIEDTTPGSNVLTLGKADSTSGNRIYLTAQKMFGGIYAVEFHGLCYINSQKHAAVLNGGGAGSLFSWNDTGAGSGSGGTLFYNVTHADPVTFTGDMYIVGAGLVKLETLYFVGNSGSKGWDLTGGTLWLGANCYMNTAANSSSNPVTITGGTLKVEGRLISQGARKSIANGNAGTYTVDAWGGRANNDVQAGITANGLVVDSTVT